MQLFKSSLLLILCMLVLSVYGECPAAELNCLQCLNIPAHCVSSADNRQLECRPSNLNNCHPLKCPTSSHVCMALWQRNSATTNWTLISGCVTHIDACGFNETCKSLEVVPNSLATGTYRCQCYGNFCNQNFLVDIEPIISTSTVIEVSSTIPVINPSQTLESGSNTLSTTATPTPTMELDESDCANCTDVIPNCTLSENKRSLQCVIDNECVNNIRRCDRRCAASWHRSSPSNPWMVTTGCAVGTGTAEPTCQVDISLIELLRRIGQPVPNGSVETGSFLCTCLGALCSNEFGIDLDALTSMTSSTPPPLSSTNPITFSTVMSTTPIPNISTTIVPTDTTTTIIPTDTTITTTNTVMTTNDLVSDIVHSDGKFVYYPL